MGRDRPAYRPERDLPAFPPFLHDRNALEALGSQEVLLASTWEFFVTLAARRPLLLAIDDLHWADPGSLDLLRFAARQVREHAILLAATYREDELTRRHSLYQLPPVLARETQALCLDLTWLDANAVDAIVAARHALEPAERERLAACLTERSGGNPFFVEELLHALETDRLLRHDGDRWILGDLRLAPVPRLIRQVIERRVEQLNDDARTVLAAAAVIGQHVPLDLWTQVADAGDVALDRAIEGALEAHLLKEDAAARRLRFTHALLREALYESVIPTRRRIWHSRVAETLERSSRPDPDAVAHHYAQAGDRRAVDWLIRAGERAERAYAWRTGAALELADRGSRAGEAGWLVFRVGRLMTLADHAQALACLEDAGRVAEETGDAVLAAYAMRDRGFHRCVTGDFRRGLAERLSQRPSRGRYLFGLTAREVDVLRLVAQGLTDVEVAERLFVSPRTVSTHLTSIYGKLGVSSRAAATRIAVERGIV